MYVLTILVGAFAFQSLFDVGVTRWYENHNRGKLWSDLKLKLSSADGDDEDDDE